MSSDARRWFCHGGTFGWCARGRVLELIGVFLRRSGALPRGLSVVDPR